MKAIISDIHGNFAALEAVLAKIAEMNVTNIVCLGDIAGYYSEINQCCDLLRSMDIACLMGNHDYYLVNSVPCPRSNSANDCLNYQKSVIAQSNFEWLSSLVPISSWQGIEVAHGGWLDPLDEYLEPNDTYFDQIRGSRFSSGHTHVPLIWSGNKKQYCNPGSVGQPRDGNPKASFAIWNGENFEIIRVAYDIAKTQKMMSKAGFTSYYWKNLNFGLQIGADKLRK